jgi:tetratricopeptide (TPR) repeat protein
MRHTSSGMVATFEPYENRVVGLLVQAKLRATEPLLETEPAKALDIYEKARAIDPTLEVDCAFQYDYGVALYKLGRAAAGERAFEQVLRLEPGPQRETLAHFYLAEFARMARRPDEAKRHYARALEINGAAPSVMETIRKQAQQP